MRRRSTYSLLSGGLLVSLWYAGCGDTDAVVPGPSPEVTFVRLATLSGELGRSNKSAAWSPAGKRLAYQRWNGTAYDLMVYDADHPGSPPIVVSSGDFSRVISWSPASDWILCMSQASTDVGTDFYSLVAFAVVAGASPSVLLARTEVNWGVWGANGRIYWWDMQNVQRRTLPPPLMWSTPNPGPFRDRTILINLWDHRAPANLRARTYWFQTSPESLGTFDFWNTGQVEPTRSATEVFADGQRFIAIVPWPCAENDIVDREGRVLTRFSPCDEPPFTAWVVTSDSHYIIGLAEQDNGELPTISRVYAASVDASWCVPVEHTPQGGFCAASRAGYSLALETLAADSLYVGNLVISDPNRREFARKEAGHE